MRVFLLIVFLAVSTSSFAKGGKKDGMWKFMVYQACTTQVELLVPSEKAVTKRAALMVECHQAYNAPWAPKGLRIAEK